ncbi:MAG: hypothetical protein WCL14_12850 [Bacteroidota bacterium]
MISQSDNSPSVLAQSTIPFRRKNLKGNVRLLKASAKRQSFFAPARLFDESLDEQPAMEHSPDSSGSPLLCIVNGDAAATADSGTQMGRVGNIGSTKKLGIKN